MNGGFNDPMRQCHNADGRPKRQFRSLNEAERTAAKLGPHYAAYLCVFGHLHVGQRPTGDARFDSRPIPLE